MKVWLAGHLSHEVMAKPEIIAQSDMRIASGTNSRNTRNHNAKHHKFASW